MKKFLFLLILVSSLYSAQINSPIQKFISSGAVTDIVYSDNKLYSATDASCVDIFDVSKNEIIKQVKVSQITDFMGDIIDSKVYSVDKIGEKILILSQAQKGARRVHIYQNGVTKLVLPYTKKLFIAKAKFLDKDTIVLGLLSNEIISYDINKQKQN